LLIVFNFYCHRQKKAKTFNYAVMNPLMFLKCLLQLLDKNLYYFTAQDFFLSSHVMNEKVGYINTLELL